MISQLPNRSLLGHKKFLELYSWLGPCHSSLASRGSIHRICIYTSSARALPEFSWTDNAIHKVLEELFFNLEGGPRNVQSSGRKCEQFPHITPAGPKDSEVALPRVIHCAGFLGLLLRSLSLNPFLILPRHLFTASSKSCHDSMALKQLTLDDRLMGRNPDQE
jgi:hypothetical protein